MKKKIEKLYIDGIYYDEAPNTFADKIMALIGVDSKDKRSNLQSRSRWKYLTMVASILNGRGETYSPPGYKVDVKWNKDLLYAIYWLSHKSTIFPGVTKQLNTKQFCELADGVMDLFAIVFDVNIPFPNRDQLLPPAEH